MALASTASAEHRGRRGLKHLRTKLRVQLWRRERDGSKRLPEVGIKSIGSSADTIDAGSGLRSATRSRAASKLAPQAAPHWISMNRIRYIMEHKSILSWSGLAGSPEISSVGDVCDALSCSEVCTAPTTAVKAAWRPCRVSTPRRTLVALTRESRVWRRCSRGRASKPVRRRPSDVQTDALQPLGACWFDLASAAARIIGSAPGGEPRRR